MEHEPKRSWSLKRWWIPAVLGVALIAVLVWVQVAVVDVPGGAEPSLSEGGAPHDGAAPSDAGGSSGSGNAPGDSSAPMPSPGADEVLPEPGATAPIEKPPTLKEHPFDVEGKLAETVVVEVVSVQAVTAGRDIPGEVRGPAVEVLIRVRNDGADAVDLSGATVNLTYGDDDRTPAVQLADPGTSGFPGALAPGSAAEGSYVFAVPLEDAGNVRIMVDVLASEPDVVFVGQRPS